MKTRIAMVTAIAIMVLQFSTAREPAKKFATEEQKIAFATKNLIAGLHSTNSGVIESAMRISAQMKMRYSSADVTELISAINALRQKHPSGTTRYKAYIALSIFENPEWYANENSIARANDDIFFHAASKRMQEQLLSANAE